MKTLEDYLRELREVYQSDGFSTDEEDLEAFLSKMYRELSEENCSKAKLFIKDLFGNASSVNGIVELSSHDIQLKGNDYLNSLKEKKTI